MDLADIAEKSLATLKFYDESRYLTEAVIRFYEVMPESEAELNDLRNIRSVLSTLYLMMQLMLRTPYDERRMIDEHLTYLNEIKGVLFLKKNDVDNDLLRIEDAKRRKEFDKRKVVKDMQKFLSSKRYARDQVRSLDRDLKRLSEEESMTGDTLVGLDRVVDLYDKLAKKIETTSEYRKRLNKIADLTEEYDQILSDIIQPKKYFERSTELTDAEQMKIIFKILTEQEDTLTKDAIIKEILDMNHFKDYMKSLIRVFKTPSVMGFKPTYKTDYLWVTVSTPPKLWNEELTQEIYTSLAGYVTAEVSRTITVRVVDSRDEWTTRIMVVAGRGKAEDLEAFDEMQLLYEKSNSFERHLSRSYLIEHGVSALSVIEDLKNNGKKK